MKKQNLNQILIVTTTITLILIVLGIVFQQSEQEGRNGFTGVYDISGSGDIVYVSYDKGESNVYLYKDKDPIIIVDQNKKINDLTFSLDGTSLFYLVNDREIDDKQLKSRVYEYNLETGEEIELFQDDKIITEIVVDPKDESLIYYLGATTFEHYSPVARTAPHDFDIYSYHTGTGDIKRHTTLDKYNISSLQLSRTDQIAYITMDDDLEADTAEDIFESKQRTFSVPLDQPEQLSVFDYTSHTEDIYSMLYIEEENMVIYQAVSGENEKGIFQYDLYIVDMESNIEKQLTDMGNFTSDPIYSSKDEKLYFIIDTQFAEKEPNYELYRVNLDRTDVEQIKLN